MLCRPRARWRGDRDGRERVVLVAGVPHAPSRPRAGPASASARWWCAFGDDDRRARALARARFVALDLA